MVGSTVIPGFTVLGWLSFGHQAVGAATQAVEREVHPPSLAQLAAAGQRALGQIAKYSGALVSTAAIAAPVSYAVHLACSADRSRTLVRDHLATRAALTECRAQLAAPDRRAPSTSESDLLWAQRVLHQALAHQNHACLNLLGGLPAAAVESVLPVLSLAAVTGIAPLVLATLGPALVGADASLRGLAQLAHLRTARQIPAIDASTAPPSLRRYFTASEIGRQHRCWFAGLQALGQGLSVASMSLFAAAAAVHGVIALPVVAGVVLLVALGLLAYSTARYATHGTPPSRPHEDLNAILTRARPAVRAALYDAVVGESVDLQLARRRALTGLQAQRRWTAPAEFLPAWAASRWMDRQLARTPTVHASYAADALRASPDIQWALAQRTAPSPAPSASLTAHLSNDGDGDGHSASTATGPGPDSRLGTNARCGSATLTRIDANIRLCPTATANEVARLVAHGRIDQAWFYRRQAALQESRIELLFMQHHAEAEAEAI